MYIDQSSTGHGRQTSPAERSRNQVDALLRLPGSARQFDTVFPIQHLPVEILIQIFLAYFAQPHQSSSSNKPSITILLSVCASWRDIICTMPRFWRNIVVYRGHEWLDLALSRCAGAPADVTLRSPHLSSDIFTSILPRYSRSLRSVDAQDLSPSAKLLLLDFLKSTPMPILRSLTIVVGPRYREIHLNATSLPNLRRLSLTGFVISRGNDLYSQLRNLTLTGCSWSISLGAFLDLLEASSHLQSLVANRCSFPLFSATAAPPSRRRAVAMPRLHVLTLSGLPSLTIACLLSCLRLRKKIAVKLVGAAEPEQINAAALVDLLPDDPWIAVPVIQTIISVTVRPGAFIRTYGLYASGVDGRALELYASYTEDRKIVPRVFRALPLLFADAPVSKLAIDGGLEYLAEVDWVGVFKTFHHLEHIVIGGAGGLSTMFRGLHRASEETGVAQAAQAAALCCPRLSVIETDAKNSKMQAADCVFDSMLAALRVRAEQGLRLERVYLGLVHHAHDHYRKNETLYGERLRALVSCVEYLSTGIECHA